MKKYLRNALVREAPYVGAAISGTVLGIATLAGASTVTLGIVASITAGWVAVYVRSVSTPREAAQERIEEAAESARTTALLDVARLKAPAPATRARKATKKA